MARTGMSDIIAELRTLAECGTADYSIAGTDHWTDDQLQAVLDMHRTDFTMEPTYPAPVYGTAGAYEYYTFWLGKEWIEKTTGGTAIFHLQQATGALAGTADYSMDYSRGVAVFTADQYGVSWFATGSMYDVDAAAGEIWSKKAAHYAPTAMDFSAGGNSIRREQIYQHCLQQAQIFAGKGGGAVSSGDWDRSDT